MGNFLNAGLGTATAVDPEPISKGILAAAYGFSQLTQTILHVFGIGPDPNNVPASQIEQAFELAQRNINAIWHAGMLTDAQQHQGVTVMYQQAQAYLQQIIQQASDKKPYQQALANLQNSMVPSLTLSKVIASRGPQLTPKTLTLAGARQYYEGGAGWYPGSVQKAAELTDGFINDMLSSPIAQIGGLASGVGSDILSLFGETTGAPATQQTHGTSKASLVGWAAIGLVVLKLIHII